MPSVYAYYHKLLLDPASLPCREHTARAPQGSCLDDEMVEGDVFRRPVGPCGWLDERGKTLL